jgi:hypothetical protein
MKQFYIGAAIVMFSLGYYKELRSFGFGALNHRFISIPLLVRWFLGWLPEGTLSRMRSLYRDFK